MRKHGIVLITTNFLTVLTVLTIKILAQDSDIHNFCKGVLHSSHFDYICCNETMETPGITFERYWKACTVQQDDSILVAQQETTVYQTLWRVYNCIITSAVTSPITLSTFAEAMVAEYDEKLTKKIMHLVSKTNLQVEGNSLENLNTIRVTYGNIERGVCEGRYVKRSLESLTSCKSGKDIMRENIHLHGDCCNGQQLPISLTFQRREPSKKIQQCTLEFMLAGGTNQPLDATEIVQTYQTETFFNTSDAQQICIQACTVTTVQNVDPPPLPAHYGRFDWENVSEIAVQFFPSSLRTHLLKDIENKTESLEEQVDDYLHKNLYQIAFKEFSPTVNMSLIRRLFHNCEAHNMITRKIETSLNEMCQKTESKPS